jgi:periplasmic protein TonB
MRARADIYSEHEGWKRPLIWSAGLHGLLVAGIFIYAMVVGGVHGEDWGGSSSGGGAMSATLVSKSAIPLPRQEVQTENILANESPGLTQSQPKQVEQPPPEAIPIPEKTVKPQKQPKPSIDKSKVTPPPSNVVPYGENGPVNAPTTMVNLSGSPGGLSFGSGDFGARYAWYVDAVRRKVSENWHKYEIDPNISNARRVYITFEILRSGDATNIQIEQSSGVPSLDMSATRALQRIDTFGPLPPGYNGNKVAVEFWFDYKK